MTHDVPAFTIVVGSPSRILRKIDNKIGELS
jgi:acetyltransferase-like isoleucine patch superfamily enzyme